MQSRHQSHLQKLSCIQSELMTNKIVNGWTNKKVTNWYVEFCYLGSTKSKFNILVLIPIFNKLSIFFIFLEGRCKNFKVSIMSNVIYISVTSTLFISPSPLDKCINSQNETAKTHSWFTQISPIYDAHFCLTTSTAEKYIVLFKLQLVCWNVTLFTHMILG